MNNVFQINLKYPKLKKDAIPCIFPGPKYLSNPQTKRKSPRKRDSSLISSKNIEVVEVNFTILLKILINQVQYLYKYYIIIHKYYE